MATLTADDHLRAFGDAVRRARRERDLSQEALARAAGVHANQVRRLELGTADVRTSTMLRIVAGLGAPFPELVRDYEHSLPDDGASPRHAP
jgi:transcriptional regulator with XRE-family HTH domain